MISLINLNIWIINQDLRQKSIANIRYIIIYLPIYYNNMMQEVSYIIINKYGSRILLSCIVHTIRILDIPINFTINVLCDLFILET